MVLERVFEHLKKESLEQAADLSKRANDEYSRGNVKEGQALSQYSVLVAGEVIKISEIYQSTITQLGEIGKKDPPVETVREFVEELNKAQPEEQHVLKEGEPQEVEGNPEADIEGYLKDPRKLELSNRQIKTAYAAFEINSDRTGFRYGSNRDIRAAVYGDKLEGMKDQEYDDELKKFFGQDSNVRKKTTAKIGVAMTLSEDQLPKGMSEFLQWLRDQEEYAELTPAQAADIIQRKMTFEALPKTRNKKDAKDDLKQSATPAATSAVLQAPTFLGNSNERRDDSLILDEKNMQILAQAVIGNDGSQPNGSGIKVQEKDLEVLRSLVGEGGDRLDEDALGQKADIFLALKFDLARALFQNTDRLARVLLTQIARIETREDMLQFLSPLKVEKA